MIRNRKAFIGQIPLFLSIVFFMLFTITQIQAQSTLTGVIYDTTETPIEGAMVVIYNTTNSIISYTTSNTKGKYTTTVKEIPSRIEITHLGYEKQEYQLTPQELLGGTVSVDFIVSENVKALDDVIIFSYKHKEKDTVVFDLQKLALHKDSNLKEILQKIPNFKLGSNGTIIYKGKNIDKVLVNKKESFTHQNSIALESIENRIIEDISVINNYSDTFSIDFNDTKESVLNIDTKTTSKTIKSGELAGTYGYQDMYEVKAKGLLFSQQMNAFVTHHTNTTGKHTFKANELQKLFTGQHALSTYQARSLHTLFSTDENLKKNVFSSTNLTLRNQGERLKTSGVFYYITPNRIDVSSIVLNAISGTPLLENTSSEKANASAFLGALSLAYKTTTNTIVSYTLHTGIHHDRQKSQIENQLFSTQDTVPPVLNTIASTYKQDLSTLYNGVALTSKLSPKLILNADTGFHMEQGNFFNVYQIRQDTIAPIDQVQNYAYKHTIFKGKSSIRYKYNTQFLPSATVSYQETEEQINDRSTSTEVISRTTRDYLFTLGASGRQLFKRVQYQATLALDYAENHVDTTRTVYTTFVPYTASVVYENKMHRWYLGALRNRKVNTLETGITRLQPFNQMVSGSITFPQTYYTLSQWSANYDYTNIFDGKSFSLGFTYTQYQDQLQNYLIQIANGISIYDTFLSKSADTYTASAYYAATLLPLKHPTKIESGLSYSATKFPTRLGTEVIDITTESISPSLALTTNTNHLINFKIGSQASFTTNTTSGTSYDALYTYSSFSTLLKNKQWEGNLTLIYEHNVIDDEVYSRKNINIECAYTHHKFTFSLEARHLGEVLSLIDNMAYNSRFSIANGVSTLTTSNQSLNYIILGIDYRF